MKSWGKTKRCNKQIKRNKLWKSLTYADEQSPKIKGTEPFVFILLGGASTHYQ